MRWWGGVGGGGRLRGWGAAAWAFCLVCGHFHPLQLLTALPVPFKSTPRFELENWGLHLCALLATADFVVYIIGNERRVRTSALSSAQAAQTLDSRELAELFPGHQIPTLFCLLLQFRVN